MYFVRAVVTLSLLITAIIFASCDSVEEGGIEVVAYTDSLVITEELLQQDGSWEVEVEEDFVTLSSVKNNGKITERLALLNVPGKPLPVAPAFTFQQGGETFTLYEGAVAIQDWDVNGVMSGHVNGRMYEENNPLNNRIGIDVLFWVDRSAR